MSKKKTAASSRLEPYRAKRSAQTTPEPFGSQDLSRPRLFVVQKHAATRLHYDFRLEWRGTLLSWAVPKGPSMDPADKRYAVHVEDHPVDYADFEGVIPKDNYGAGPVIVWDKGLWWPIDDPDALEQTGKLHFQLRGYKLRGEWYLVRMQGKDWLLRKKADDWATTVPRYGEESVHSGLTLEELRDGHDRSAKLVAALEAAGAPRRRLDVMQVDLVLAETAEAAFSSPEWIFELKYDGYRILASRSADAQVLLRSRNAHDLTATFPEVARALRSLPYDVVLDGEVVVLGDDGRSQFGELQKRAKLHRPADVERAAVERPATYFVFDLLGFDGYDLRNLPLVQRKQMLQTVLPRLGPVRYADHVAAQGIEMFEKVRTMGLEGIIAKRADSPYRGGRGPAWQKIVADRTADFVVCGFTVPRGARGGFGALHLGVYENGALVYAGRVGTGFNDAQLEELRAGLDTIGRDTPPCASAPVSRSGEHHWVEPEWVAEVRYKEVTGDGLLRAPVFVRLRTDKSPAECTRTPKPQADADAAPTPAPPRAEPAAIKFTNLDKVFFPEHGYTKKDLIEYYRSVADWMLPYLRDRPLVLTRYPDGIHGKSFYQKNAPEFVPRWIRRVSIWSDSSEREIEYFVCDDLNALLYIANMGAVPLHVWSSRASSIQYPDFCILDLDPKDAPFKDVVTLALAIRRLCEEIELPAFPKTTGSSGLHILVPLGGQCTFEQSRMLGQLVSRLIATEHAEIATIARTMSARKGRVYLDFLQNRHGQLIVAPYSVRPFPGAPVSAPLEWREVTMKLTPQQFTIRNLPERLARRKDDPLRPVLEARPDLVGALARLAERIDRAQS
jgi:bifunctional non-homologous end joining protein LigD